MTARVVLRAELPQLAASLFAGHHLLMLVPATADVSWAAETAWECARAAATGARKVLLVDLSLADRALDDGASNRIPRGIVDAFVADAPLSDVSREQDRPGLHYIGRGAPAPDGRAIWSSPRWQRLARGFENEGALLLLFAPAGALGAFPPDPDGVVVLAAQGYDPAAGAFPRIAERLARGTPLLAVVASQGSTPTREPPTPRPVAGAPMRVRPTRPGVVRRPPRGHRVLGALGVIALASTVVLWSRAARPDRPRRAFGPAPQPAFPAPALSAPVPGDSLYYSVQVAAYNTLAQAMEHARRLERRRRPAIVTPVRLGNQGLWYRVLVGAYPNARAADSALQELWRTAVVERPQGTILRTPETYRVRAVPTLAGAEDEVLGLRGRGIPAYIVQAPDSTALVYVGAFDLPEQVRTADSLLTAAGLAGTLVQRMGITP